MLLIKKYLLPIVLSVFLYTILYIFDFTKSYFSIYLIKLILFIILIRVIDDIKDFEKDTLRNRCVFNKKTLIGLLISLIVILFTITFYYQSYLLLVSIIFIIIGNLKFKYFKYFKSLFLPSVIIFISYYYFGINYYCVVFSLLIFIGDLYLIKKSGD